MAVAFLESFSIAAIIPVLSSLVGTVGAAGSSSNIIVNFTNRILSLIPISDKMIAAVILLLLVTILKGAARILNEWAIAYSSGKILYDTRRELMERLGERTYQYFLDNKQGQVGYYLTNGTTKVGTLIFKASQLISELLMIFSIVALLFMLNVYVTLACIGIGVLFSMLVGAIARNVSYTLGKGRMDSSSGQSIVFNEFFNGIKQIIVFGAKNKWLSKFNKYNKEFTGFYVKDFVWLAMPTNLMETLGISVILLTVLILKSQVTGGNIVTFLPLIGVFAMSLLKILPALGTVGRARLEIVGALPDAQAIVETLYSAPRPVWPGKREFESFDKSIQFIHIAFSHGNKQLLKDITFSIEKNGMTAIAGSSGAGKTTIINLLLGLFLPSNGRIVIDGVNLNDYDIESFRKKIGFVSQDSFIFHSTIKENITFSSDGYSEEDISKAARLAGIHDFIESLKDGYDTVVGERGMKLSGGQQQRIAIARALIRKPELIILDEATSALDNKSIYEIHEAINALSGKYTITIIAHSLPAIKDADKIVVLNDGTISDEGRHDELLKRRGAYFTLYNGGRNAPYQ